MSVLDLLPMVHHSAASAFPHPHTDILALLLLPPLLLLLLLLPPPPPPPLLLLLLLQLLPPPPLLLLLLPCCSLHSPCRASGLLVSGTHLAQSKAVTLAALSFTIFEDC
jgi:hypothetical protein